ncbi:MAG: class I SAM-dependent methyltransferase [Myxococcota bacterium]
MTDLDLEERSPSLVERLDGRWYPDVRDNWDDELFRDRILERMSEDFHVLDIGAGAGFVAQMNFKGRCASIVGLDLDPRVVDNPYLDEGRHGGAEEVPWPDEQFDLVFSDNVLEHLAEPERVFEEVARVLKPGGRFLVKTPNKLHYVPLVASLTPHSFHRFFNRLRGRPPEDTFPTRYRANTPSAVARLAEAAGLVVRSVDLIESRPEYLRISAPTYLVGWIWERIVNHVPALSRFRVLLVAEFEKPMLSGSGR